jgi:tyrosyl-tRNA synthetase
MLLFTRAFYSLVPRTGSRLLSVSLSNDSRNSHTAADLKSSFLKLAKERGFIFQCTDVQQLDCIMDASQPISAYIGFDATAKSLHVGSLLQIMLLRHLQKSGHKPIILMGGGTTKIGDPSGKDESRKLITNLTIQENISSLSKVFSKFLKFGDGPTDAIMVNNDDWLSSLNYLEFLQKYGRHFTINRMMNYDSVRSRLEREQPLTFLEFNYMILQAYDFVELNKRFGTVLQIGGSDQWGNIVCGVELSRKLNQKSLFGLTAPLLQTSSGSKMGKSANGAVWLNSLVSLINAILYGGVYLSILICCRDMLSPLDYWQFWRNTADADVVRYVKITYIYCTSVQ